MISAPTKFFTSKEKTRDFSIVIFVWVICTYLLSHYVVFVINTSILAMLLFKNKGCFQLFRGAWFFILYFIFGFCIGLCHVAEGVSLFSDFFRDFLYWANPFFGLLIGANLAKDYRFAKVMNSLNFGLLFALIWVVMKTLMIMLESGVSIDESVAYPDFYFFLALLLNKNIRKQITKFRFAIYANILLILFCFLLSFSRISLVVFAVSYLIINFNKKTFFQNAIKIIGFAFFAFLVISAVSSFIPTFNDTFAYFVKKIANSLAEVSSSNVWDDANVVTNWRGYEIYRASLEFAKGNIAEKFFGYGWGKGVDMGGYAYLVVTRSDALIPVLHNEYMTLLVKFGVVGLGAYILFYLSSFISACKMKGSHLFRKILISVVLCFAFRSYVTMIIFGSGAPGLALLFWGYLSVKTQQVSYRPPRTYFASRRTYQCQ